MNPVLLLHIAAFGFWMGVLAVEFIIERQRGKSREQGYAIASYHYHISTDSPSCPRSLCSS